MSEGQGSGLKKRATLADVAAQAGVSRALVSIVIRDVPGASAATRERVLRVADDLGYRPDARARLLARSQSKLLGVVFGLSGTFHFGLLDGLYAAAEKRGYELILSALTQGRDEDKAVESLQDFRFDALIMLGPATEKPTWAGKVPLVVMGWHVDHPAVDVVRTSDEDGTAMAIDHLVELGHRRITHVDGGEGLVAQARRDGYVAAMRTHGLDQHICILPGGLTQMEGYDAAQALLKSAELPTAVVTFNDEIAVSILQVFSHAGIEVPADVSVIGWDDSPVSRLPHLQLTTIRQDARAMADAAIARAIARVEDQHIAEREIVLEPQLMLRSTTSKCRTESTTRP